VKENSIDDQTKDADGHSAETAVPNVSVNSPHECGGRGRKSNMFSVRADDAHIVLQSLLADQVWGSTQDQQVGNGTNEKIQSTGAPIMAPEIILGSGKQLSKDQVSISAGISLLTVAPVHDEGLKRLLMSWYYAGYYTGLHEGRSNQNGPGQG